MLSDTPVSSRSKATATRWKITQSIERLQAAPPSADYSPEILAQVLAVLRQWDTAWTGDAAYQSFLNKKSFQHEIEECLPALHHLNEWRKTSCTISRFVAMDVCGGKGCFSMLLRYVASLYWNKDGVASRPVLDHVILLEKAKRDEIDWHHLLQPTDESIIPLVLWDGCNLHETDALVDRIRLDVPIPIAAIGIHLCKLLSPALVSLVNLLGPHQCAYTCLVPCCMPRAVTKTAQRHLRGAKHTKRKNGTMTVDTTATRQPSFIPVSTYETNDERAARLERIQRRDAARRRKGRFPNRSLDSSTENADALGCFCCQSTLHQLQFCPEVQTMSNDARHAILLAAAPSLTLTPCWNCGMTGHYQADCPNGRIVTVVNNGETVTSLIEPRQTLLDVTHILDLDDPMRAYCDLLLNAMYYTSNSVFGESNINNFSRTIWETALVNTKAENQPAANWNGGRKALYMVVYAT